MLRIIDMLAGVSQMFIDKGDEMFRRCLLLAMVGLAWMPGAALAQVTPAQGVTPPDDTQAIKIGAVLFADWTRTFEPKATDAAGNSYSPNAFNVTRAYINVTGNISHRVSFRITPDITRESGVGSSLAGSLTFRIKYGYAQYSLDDWTGDWKQTWVRFGIQQTPFIDAEEGVYRYRFQGTVFVERDGGLSSSDAGATVHTSLPGGYGDIHTGVYNGEGYSRVETNNQKAFMFRTTIRPFPGGGTLTKGIRVTGFYIGDHYVKDAPRSRGVGSVWYEHRRFNAGFDYINEHDQTLPTNANVNAEGWSVFATPFFKEKGNGPEMLLRYDHFKPDTSLDQTRKRTIAGFAYWFPHPGGASTAALMLDYEQVTFDGFPSTAAFVTQKRLALHGLINF
jgi:hypothetical protein